VGESALWDSRTGVRVADLGYKRGVFSVAFSPDGEMLATASYEGESALWDARTGARVADLGEALYVAFSPDGGLVATCACDLLRPGPVALWDARTGARVADLGDADSVAFSPDGGVFAVCRNGGEVRLWNMCTRAAVGTIRIISGIDIHGLDLSHAILSDEDRKTLRQNGARA
jgi:WD40 repeat protein